MRSPLPIIFLHMKSVLNAVFVFSSMYLFPAKFRIKNDSERLTVAEHFFDHIILGRYWVVTYQIIYFSIEGYTIEIPFDVSALAIIK